MARRSSSSAADSLATILLMLVLALAGYTGYGIYSTPEISSASPSLVRPGEVLTLRGARFAANPGDIAVLFGSQSGKVTRATADEIQVEIPDVAGRGTGTTRLPVRVVVGSRVSAPLEITLTGESAAVLPPPSASPSPPSASPLPGLEPAVSPPPAPSVAVRSTPSASPPPAPAPRAADWVAEARSASAKREYDSAAASYEKALALEPENRDARAGLAAAQTASASLRRTFVVGTTQTTGRQARGDFKDFDTREVAVMKPPDIPARLECEVSPSRLAPGDAYSVKVYLTNEGTKGIKLASLSVATTVNGLRTGGAVAKLAEEAAPRTRTLVYRREGVWGESVTSWALAVEVKSSRGDSYGNRVTWK